MHLETQARFAGIIGFGFLVACSGGASGTDGTNGSDGKNGAIGAPGADGANGATGSKGATGATGAEGPQGDAGAEGPQGEQGEAGAQGPQGDAGTFTSHFMYAFTDATPSIVADQSPFFFTSGIIDGSGFVYDSTSGTFTVATAGDYEFEIIIAADDGATGSSSEFIAQFPEVPRSSDSDIDCQVPIPGTTVQCTASFIMSLDAGQTFTLTNVGGTTAYYGTYQGNPFVNTLQMTVRQLD